MKNYYIKYKKIINSKEYNNIFLYNKLLRIYVKNIFIILFFIKQHDK